VIWVGRESGVGGRSDDVDDADVDRESRVVDRSDDVDDPVSDSRLPTPDSPGGSVVTFGVVPAAIHANAPRTTAPSANASFFIARESPAFRASPLLPARSRPNS
jgi:hypothetical protein